MTMPMIFLMSAMFLALWPTLGQGQSVSETANLDGATAGTSSTGTGSAVVVLTYANTSLALSTTFAGLTSGTMMAHIHCCTASPGVGTAGPATPLPSLPGFPLGVQNGMSYVVLDMSMVSSYSAPFLAMNGNNATAAWLTLYNGITAGLAYFNIHTISYPNGEIAGFFQENKIQPAPSGPITTSGLGPCNADNGCNSANSGGHCADHACVCNPGFTGYQCETSSNGTTTPGLAACAFDTGCNAGNTGGKCVANACVCNPGFSGINCETGPNGTASGLGLCYGDGACNSANHGGWCNGTYCQCAEGFTGLQCQTGPNGTASGLGTCNDDTGCNSGNAGGTCDSSFFFCHCSPFFDGTQCETRTGACSTIPEGWITSDYSYRQCDKWYVLLQLADFGCEDAGPGCGLVCKETVPADILNAACPDPTGALIPVVGN